jgi:hypothetical protein
MPLYFLLHDGAILHGTIAPALADAWRQRRFAPCQVLCERWLPVARSFADQYHTGGGDPLLAAVLGGLAFDRTLWRSLAGELLWYAAIEVPEVPMAIEALTGLLAPGRTGTARDRETATPIEQAHYGAHDLRFGPICYRPDAVGINQPANVANLSNWLASVDPRMWTTDALVGPDAANDADLAEELDYARQCFDALRGLYGRAAEKNWDVVSEVL